MRYTARQYAQTLYELLEQEPGKARETIKRFVSTLSANGQLHIARALIGEFETEWNKQKGIIPVEITSAQPHGLTTKRLEEMLGASIELSEKSDPTLGAGIRLRIKDYQIDNTLSRRMQELKKAIAR